MTPFGHRASSLPIIRDAPELTGITAWINSAPLSLSGLRGKVVLVHFWSLGCGTCEYVAPLVAELQRKYTAKGLVIIGVHTPEFPREKDATRLKIAIDQNGITYPVAVDNDYATWNAYHNRFWPADYLVDKGGKIRLAQADTKYEALDRAIAELLG